MASAIIAQLLFLQAESSTRPIHIYINSPGIFSWIWLKSQIYLKYLSFCRRSDYSWTSYLRHYSVRLKFFTLLIIKHKYSMYDVYHFFFIFCCKRYVTAPVATCCIGQAASMGSLLLCAGRPGLRYALPNSRIMVHQPSGGFQVRCNTLLFCYLY